MDSDSEGSYDDDIVISDEEILQDIQYIKDNDSFFTDWWCSGDYDVIRNMTNEEWEQLGRDISNNTHLKSIEFCEDALDDEVMSFFLSGLTGSSSIREFIMSYNAFSASGARSMVPFLQQAKKLRKLDINCWTTNSLDSRPQSDGFDLLLGALRDSPIEHLFCHDCGIETIEIGNDFPKKLKELSLEGNKINSSGSRTIAKLLRRGDSVLTRLDLSRNETIGDECVAILVDALQNNTTLKELSLCWNDCISVKGQIELSKLMIDISSIKSTLQSNHTLESVKAFKMGSSLKEAYVHKYINIATSINKDSTSQDFAGIEKVRRTQLLGVERAELAELQGVSHSVYSEIHPLHLPEVLSLVSRHHGRGELYAALKLSIATLISMVDTKQRIKQNASHYAARLEELRAEVAYCMGRSEEMNENLAKIEAAEGRGTLETKSGDMDASRPSKRSRT